MTSKFGLVVSDVDGTLVTKDKVLTPRAIAAVHALHAAGIGFSICSSRPPFGLRMLVEPLQLKLPYGGYNAGRIVDPDGKVVEEKLIPADAAKQAVEMFYDNGITSIWVFSGNQWLIRDRNGAHVDHETHTVQTPPTVVDSFDGHLGAAGKIVGASDDYDRVAASEAQGRAALAGRATVGRSQQYYCDVTPPGINKGRIVELLGERLGVERERIATFGDMGNDAEMFKKAGFAVAMGNASPEIKAMAQAVTLSNEEDGFAIGIERYILGSAAA
jgi:Cof subfamily protein (haloacid dehalogenase superfamily)